MHVFEAIGQVIVWVESGEKGYGCNEEVVRGGVNVNANGLLTLLRSHGGWSMYMLLDNSIMNRECFKLLGK